MKAEPVIYHADDFGANREISEHILDCCRKGALNSLSVLPNSPHLEECMQLLTPYRKEITISIHFNLAEGPCLAEAAQLPWLVDERGMFSISFFKVLMLSLTGKRAELKRQIKTELKAQLARMLPYVDTLRLDSHQHYHMIPVVLESILEAVKELPRTEAGSAWIKTVENGDSHQAEPAFIRIPAEPLMPFLKHPELYLTYRPINLVKNLVLKLLNIRAAGLLAPYRTKSAVFFGILLSGRMDLRRVSILKKAFQRIAERRQLPLEILCHPGGVEKQDELLDQENKDCVAFYTSDGRKAEKEMLMHIQSK